MAVHHRNINVLEKQNFFLQHLQQNVIISTALIYQNQISIEC